MSKKNVLICVFSSVCLMIVGVILYLFTYHIFGVICIVVAYLFGQIVKIIDDYKLDKKRKLEAMSNE